MKLTLQVESGTKHRVAFFVREGGDGRVVLGTNALPQLGPYIADLRNTHSGTRRTVVEKFVQVGVPRKRKKRKQQLETAPLTEMSPNRKGVREEVANCKVASSTKSRSGRFQHGVNLAGAKLTVAGENTRICNPVRSLERQLKRAKRGRLSEAARNRLNRNSQCSSLRNDVKTTESGAESRTKSHKYCIRPLNSIFRYSRRWMQGQPLDLVDDCHDAGSQGGNRPSMVQQHSFYGGGRRPVVSFLVSKGQDARVVNPHYAQVKSRDDSYRRRGMSRMDAVAPIGNDY